MKNRMREICTSGSVRGGDGNVPTYSAVDFFDAGSETSAKAAGRRDRLVPEKASLAGAWSSHAAE